MVAAILLPGAVGCANGSAPAEPVGPVQPLSAAEQELLARGEERLVRHCMSRQGFVYHEVAPLPAENGEEHRVFPYVVDDVSWARKYGYGAVRSAQPGGQPPVPGPNEAYVNSLPPERQRVYTVTLQGQGGQLSVPLPHGARISASDRGCLAEARRSLYGDLPRWFRAKNIAQRVAKFVQDEVRADARYQQAVRDWAACIRRSGRDVADPKQLHKELAHRTRQLDKVAAKSLEVETAVAEATCATSIGMTAIVGELEREHEPAVRATYQRELTDFATLNQAALPRAQELLTHP
ncbi:hypothetical protein [Amycolatopsis anabasis]|uniref:hypothetical protein n=1 Tax=Amycolatopsis anabasis TaxID=1840409 RepID=UPI00131E2A4C|nr:hypothetical protein [Amycolatopsis anabasis]